MAGFPGAFPTCPVNTLGLWWAKIATAATPADSVYRHTIPVPPAELVTGPVTEAPSAALAWAVVGHTAAVVVADVVGAEEVAEVAVVADEPVVDEERAVVVGLLLPELQPA